MFNDDLLLWSPPLDFFMINLFANTYRCLMTTFCFGLLLLISFWLNLFKKYLQMLNDDLCLSLLLLNSPWLDLFFIPYRYLMTTFFLISPWLDLFFFIPNGVKWRPLALVSPWLDLCCFLPNGHLMTTFFLIFPWLDLFYFIPKRCLMTTFCLSLSLTRSVLCTPCAWLWLRPWSSWWRSQWLVCSPAPLALPSSLLASKPLWVSDFLSVILLLQGSPVPRSCPPVCRRRNNCGWVIVCQL